MLQASTDFQKPLAGQRILVVEDEPWLAEDMVETLREVGAEVIGTAPSVSRALSIIQSAPTLDAAVIDVNLAGELAYPVVDALIALKRPFVFSTVCRPDELPYQYRGAPRCAKPTQPLVLLKELQQVLGLQAHLLIDETAVWIHAIAKFRDKEAFKALFAAQAPRVKRYLLTRGAPDAVADELVQEVMLTIWRKAERFDASRAAGAAWVFAIARNLQIDGFRRDGRNREDATNFSLTLSSPQTPEEACLRKSRDESLRKALAELPIEQADLLMMSFFGDQAHAGIALSSGLPLGTVKSRLRSALSALRMKLSDAD